MIPTRPLHIGAARGEFEQRLEQDCPSARHAECVSTLMLNVGLACNLACELCHQSSSPQRAESMSQAIMLMALEFAGEMRPDLIDVTGGEPTMWPLIRDLVVLGRAIAPRMRVRTNLDALLLPGQAGLPQLLAENNVEVLASLPEALEGRTIGRCVEALKLLVGTGYGDPRRGARAPLDIAYNPLPGEMPGDQESIQRDFQLALAPHGIAFRSLVAIANVPVGGFAKVLAEAGDRDTYRAALRAAYNPDVLPLLECRRGIEIAWDGSLWDCDFNFAAGVPLAEGATNLSDYVGSQVGQLALTTRLIAFADHCFACAAARGSG